MCIMYFGLKYNKKEFMGNASDILSLEAIKVIASITNGQELVVNKIKCGELNVNKVMG